MNTKFVCWLLTAALLGACGKSETPVQPKAVPVSEPAQSAVAIPRPPQGDAVLMDGYVPAFAHKVRSQRAEGSTHFVVMEYLGVDRDAAIAALSESLRDKGFKITGPRAREGAVQYIYSNSEGRRMSAIFSDPSAKLMNHDAQGIAMFSWADASPK